ncbi:MAG TPA: SMP-30/gluconolactonase/LRE family protein [Gemmataceae bacterium]|nr:SMP-30/gluconolactonase/LRE family protein [Gemmataceae bacterium]
MLRFVLPTIASLLLVVPLSAQEEKIPHIGPAGKITKLDAKFQFTEGPAVDAKGNVYFTDIPAEKIHKYGVDGKLSTFVENSNHANGLMFNSKGELVACEMDGQIVAYDIASKKKRTVIDKYDGNRFNAPNDLVVDKSDGVYFTDPSFRAPKPMPQNKLGVYYTDGKGKVTRVIDNLPNPNGVLLSIDEKTLFVFPTGQAGMMAYPIESPGKIGKGKIFCNLKQPEGKQGTGADGATIDNKGNLYITSAIGIQVFDPHGKLLGVIRLPEQPANCCFGGADMKTLCVTARTSFYTIPMEATGHRYASGK